MKASYIPMDVILDIMQRLPVKSLMRFRSVSKFWCNLIPLALEATKNQSGNLSVVYTDNYYLYVIDDIHNPSQPTKVKLPWTGFVSNPISCTFEVAQIVGSCNGLLCVCNSYDSCLIALCNPLTRTIREIIHPFKKPPRVPPYCHHENMSRQLKGPAIFGFGYDMRNDDYKILTINKLGEGALIYSLRSNSWTMPAQAPPNGKHGSYNPWPSMFGTVKNAHGFYSNNKLHWLTRRGRHYREISILCFDLSSEQWDELPLPIHALSSDKYINQRVDLGVLDGCLCLFIRHYHSMALLAYQDKVYDTWVMKKSGEERSWTKLATLNYKIGTETMPEPEMGPQLLAYSKSDGHEKILLSKHNGLFWYDLKENSNMRFEQDPLQSSCGFWPCGKSFIANPESYSKLSDNVYD